MINILEIDGHRAVVSFDPDIVMFRGEFLGLAGGADFYADNVEDLRKEGRKSLQIFIEICAEKNINPFRQFSGKFNVRLNPKVHEAAVIAATAKNESLNDWVINAIEKAIGDE